MAEILFAFNEKNFHTCQDNFRGPRNQEYYLGDYTIEASSLIDVRAERKSVGPMSIIHQRSRSRMFFRRAWTHIRQDATDVGLLWFLKRGSLSITAHGEQKIAGPGEFVLTRSMTPFFVECQPDDERVHEVLQVTVPTHILRNFVSDDVRTGFAMPMARREFAIAEHILSDILEDDDSLAAENAQILLESALSVVGRAIRDSDEVGPSRQTVSHRRLQEVLRFIELHLSDSNLSTTMVASGCGISPRYLSFLLRLHGTSFSSLVWEQRLQKAKTWLGSTRPHEVSISEVAYNMGFKSPAHFSRMFKRVFNVNPRDYRAPCTEQAPGARPQLYLAAGNSLQ